MINRGDMYRKYGADGYNQMVEEAMQVIKNGDSVEIGKYLDKLYLQVGEEFKEYYHILDHATYLLEESMTDEEIEAQDQKMRNSKPGIRRPRSAHEMTLDEMFGRLKDGTYWNQLAAPQKPVAEMISIDGSFTAICADESLLKVRLGIGKDEDNYPPHFHFYENIPMDIELPKSRYDGGCILLQEAKYLIHDAHDTRMSENEINALIDWLNSKHFSGVTVWQHIISIWNENNPERLVLPEAEIPPYNAKMHSVVDRKTVSPQITKHMSPGYIEI